MIVKIIEAFRDLLLGFLPKFFCKPFLNQGAEFAFLCHPLDARDAARKYPFVKGISEKWFQLWVQSFWPVLGSPVIGPQKARQKLDSKGWVVICPYSPEIMVRNPDQARKMILWSIRLCEKLGVKLIALGGYNSIITRDGNDLIGKTKLAVTTGNTYSALLVIQNLKKIAGELSIPLSGLKVGVVGAAGSVGTACSTILPSLVKELWLMDLNGRELKVLADDLTKQFNNVFVFQSLSEIKLFDVVITVTSTPRAIVHAEDVRPGMIFIDAAQPYNVSEELPKEREDVLVISSGIAKLPRLPCEIDLGPFESEVYACIGEAIALTCFDQYENYSIGKVKADQVFKLEKIVTELDFRVADFRNSAGFISKEQLETFRSRYFLKYHEYK